MTHIIGFAVLQLRRTGVVVLLFLANLLHAQNINYSFSYFTNEVGYRDLIGDSVLATGPWGSGGFIGFFKDDNVVPIAFDFKFFDSTIHKLYITQDATVLSSLSNSDSNMTGIPRDVLCPLHTLMYDKAWHPYLHFVPGIVYDSAHPGYAPLSPVSFKVDGLAPYRALKIQYKNVGFECDTSGTAFINFQVWLYETTNIIEYHYGPQSIHPSIFNYPQMANDSGRVQGTYVALINGTIPGNCSSPGRSFSVQGANAAPYLQYYPYPAFLSIVPWPYLYQVPPNRMVYRFAPYLDTTSVAGPDPTAVLAIDLASIRITVSPNPVTDVVVISHGGITNGTVTLVDMSGRILQQRQLNEGDRLDISQLARGNYVVKIRSNGRDYSCGFVKQ